MPSVLNVRFSFTSEGFSLDPFTGVEGLEAEYEVEEYQEGGNNGYVHRLPGRVSYSNIVLSRAVDGHSRDLAAWFTKAQEKPGRTTASITLHYGDTRVASWNLQGVWAVKYSGPKMASDDDAIATETLELAHNGFTFELEAPEVLSSGPGSV